MPYLCPVSNLLGEVETCILKRKLLRRGQTILVAVSGGLDSMVLLRILHDRSPRHGWKITVAHLNHCLRGRSSNADENLVRRTAEQLRLPFLVQRANVRDHAKARKLSLELAARELRHEFLAGAARKANASAIALAHHADDQTELFFLRLLRGAGTDGLAGMSWRNPSPADPKIELVRPLLGVRKDQLRDFAGTEKVRFREDATNASLDIQRNRVRHELLPLLKKHYQPALETVVSRVMEIGAGDSAFISDMANQWLAAAATAPTARHSSGKDITPFVSLPLALQRRCIHTQLLNLGLPSDFELVERLRLEPGKRVSAPSLGPLRTSASAGSFQFLICTPEGLVHLDSPHPRQTFQTSSVQVNLTLTRGKIVFDGVRLRWILQKSTPLPGRRAVAGVEVFDADQVGSPILLRHWQPGDRFQPIGMRHTVKLQDLMTNAKVPRPHRHQLLVGVNPAGTIFWVEGLRISEQFKLTPGTIRRLHWAWQRL
jgi:tRNA(Ile)-lysidine synthase